MNRWRMLLLIVGLSTMATPARAHLISATGRPECGCRHGSPHSRWRPPVYLWLVGAAAMLGLTGDDVEEATPVPAVPAPQPHVAARISHPAAPIAAPRALATAETPSIAIAAAPAPAANHQPPALPPVISISAPPRGLLAPLTASPLPMLGLLGTASLLTGAAVLRRGRAKRQRAGRARRWRRMRA